MSRTEGNSRELLVKRSGTSGHITKRKEKNTQGEEGGGTSIKERTASTNTGDANVFVGEDEKWIATSSRTY